ncbi:MAG: DUF393 domain-containing protein [Acidobacteriota bacterium]
MNGMENEGALHVIYDGRCEFCTRWKYRFETLDRRGRLVFHDFHSDRFMDRVPELTRDALETAMHLVDEKGRVYRGFDAVRRLLFINPLTAPAALLLYLPGAAQAGRAVYGVIARRRHRF